MDQQKAVPGIGGAVREHQIVHHVRAQSTRHQSGSARDKAIHQHHAPFAGGLQHGASHHGDLETSERRQGFKRPDGVAVARRRSRELLHPLHMLAVVQVADVDLVPAESIHQRHAAQARQQQGRTHRIGHAHVTQGQNIARQMTHHVHAGVHGRHRLGGGHGRADHQVARAIADLAQQQ